VVEVDERTTRYYHPHGQQHMHWGKPMNEPLVTIILMVSSTCIGGSQ
jgi:hypothetical protein